MARIELNIVALGDFKSVDSQIKNLRMQVELLNKSLTGTGLSTNLTKQLNDANNAFRASMLSTGQFTETTVKLKTETEKFGHALANGKLKLGEYFSVIKGQSSAAATSMRALAVEQTKLQNSIVTADPTKKGMFSVYTPTHIDEIANKTKIATNYQNLYNIAVNKGSQSLINWGKNTQWAGRQLTVGLTVPMAMFGAAAMKTFKEVNDELVRLQKVYGTGITAPTQKALDDIKSQVIDLTRELAASMGVAASETAAMAAGLAATGQTGNDLIGATREAMRLARLGELDQQAAMQATVSLQNVYKLSTQDLTKSINFLNAVENQTSTSLQDLVDGIPRVGPIVQQLGGSFQDTAVMMVAMKEAGVPAAQSANAIKSALASLINPSKNATEAFAGFNINLKEISTSTGGNPVKMFMALQESMKGLEPLAKAQLIEKLFGKYQQARIQALVDNLGSVNSQTRTAFDLINSSAPQLAALAASEMKIATESTTGKFRRAVETIKADLIPLGERIMQIATVLLKFGDSIAKAFGSLPGPVKTVLGVLAGAAALVGPIIMLVGLMGNFAGYILKTVFNLKNLIMGTKTFGELFTPEMIASQNAAELFGNKILEDVGAVQLLNQSVAQLIGNLNALQGGMASGTGAGIVPSIGSISPTKANSIYSYASRDEAASLFGYKGKTGEDVYSKPTSGIFTQTDKALNAALANSGVTPDRLINAMTGATGETKNKSSMFKTSGSEFLNATTMMQKDNTALITQRNANKIKAELNVEYEKELRAMQSPITDANNPYAKVADRVIKKNAALSSDPKAFISAFEGFDTSSSKTQKVGSRSGGGSSVVSAAGYNSVRVELAGKAGEEFYHSYNEKFLKVREKIVKDFRKTGNKATEGMIDAMAHTATGQAMQDKLTKASAKSGQNIADVFTKSEIKTLQKMNPALVNQAVLSQNEIEAAKLAIAEKGARRRNSLKFGKAMGLVMGGQMLASALPQGSAASSIAGSASMGAGMGMMFGPEGAAIGAALGVAYGGITSLMKAEREHEQVVRSTFKASADAIDMFGGTLKNQEPKIHSFAKNVEETTKSITDLQANVDRIAALDESSGLKQASDLIKKSNTASSVIGTARQFAAAQVANGIDPAKVKDMITAMLTYAGKTEYLSQALKSITADTKDVATATETWLNKSKQQSGGIPELAESYDDLNTRQKAYLDTSLNVVNTILDVNTSWSDAVVQAKVLEKVIGNTAGAFNMLAIAAQKVGDVELANKLAQLSSSGLSISNALTVAKAMQIAPMGPNQSYDDYYNTTLKDALKKDAAATASRNSAKIAQYNQDVAKAKAAALADSKSALEVAKKDLKVAEDKLKAEQKQTDELKKQQDYMASKTDIENKIRQAVATGNYLEANQLRQQLANTTNDYNAQSIKTPAQQEVERLQAQVAKLQAEKDAKDAAKNVVSSVAKPVLETVTSSAAIIAIIQMLITELKANTEGLVLSHSVGATATSGPDLSTLRIYADTSTETTLAELKKINEVDKKGKVVTLGKIKFVLQGKADENGIVKMKKKAQAGTTSPGRYLVGEQGPEILDIPSFGHMIGASGTSNILSRMSFPSPNGSTRIGDAYSNMGTSGSTIVNNYELGGIHIANVDSSVDIENAINDAFKKITTTQKMSGTITKVGGR